MNKIRFMSRTSPTANKVRKEVLLQRMAPPLCWGRDFEKEIVANPYKKYFQPYSKLGRREDRQPATVRYKLLIQPSRHRIVVQLNCDCPDIFVRDPAKTSYGGRQLSPQQLAIFKSAIARAMALWNEKVVMYVVDPVCGPRVLKVVYEMNLAARDSDSEFHSVISINQRPKGDRSSYYRSHYNWYGAHQMSFDAAKDWRTPSAIAHEYGHALGLADEYTDDVENYWVRYREPMGGLGPVVLVESIYADPMNDNKGDDTLMRDDSTSVVIEEHHAWNIAIEARDLFTEKLGRNVATAIFLTADLEDVASDILKPPSSYESESLQLSDVLDRAGVEGPDCQEHVLDDSWTRSNSDLLLRRRREVKAWYERQAPRGLK